MIPLSEQIYYFYGELVSFTTCFGQLGHLEVLQLCTEYLRGSFQGVSIKISRNTTSIVGILIYYILR